MTSSEQEFLRKLQATFKIEAAEHLQAIGAGLLELEKSAAPAGEVQLVETIFRAAHSLKGAARAVNFTEIESVCQSLESLFASWKRGDSQPTPQALDIAHRDVDRMSRAIAVPVTVAPAAAPDTTPARAPSRELPAATTRAPVAPRTGDTETVRIAVSSLDQHLLEAEEMLAAKLAAEGRAAELASLTHRFETWRKEWSRIEPGMRALRRTNAHTNPAGSPQLAELADFLDWNHDYLRSLEEKVAAVRRAADQDRLLVGKLVDDLLENSKKLLMMPVATLSPLLAKVVRDLCRDQGKEADFTLRGEEVTIDKRILDELKDPLIHVLRNSIDHGVEVPGERHNRGKPTRAAIALTVLPVNGQEVEITVSDDGAGIDLQKVRAAAHERGLLGPGSTLDPDAATLALVFEPDVSTSPAVTQVSGRGLGLAIVREKTETLGGRVTLESQLHVGTTIRMRLPLTLSTFRGVLIRVSRRLFVVPTSNVERVLRFHASDVQTVEGRPTLAHQGRTLALADMAQVLQLAPVKAATAPTEATPALILSAGEQRIAFAVESIIDEREVLVKQLTKPLSRVRNIAGATVLSSGEVAPILNIQDLLKSARAAHTPLQAPAAAVAVPARKRILVAEDSVTSRMLLKGILESAGYQVKTAVDGIEALTTLRLEHFDLVISDVEMPRMNGFDLTARIRAERTLADLPVVLVTALAAPEDRERGVDVGANAYLVKSSFDQSDLLEALRRLA